MRNFEFLLRERLGEPTPVIQVLLGPRQVGKTTGILRIFESWPGEKNLC
jgi:predicted AAA+ superfamily ATPase